ncbi:hypothetical protein [Streptomyces narbonensis]|uniref:hypothetical protein n=1 Tax=Streptomyces narbonensis TaxID=67333 RepID=UPI0016795F1D|nr:hypothetical protein [Streptomyces narbonensis]GGW05968.1 hypothetical protein GCM10010230_47050 [Streptomyces narbonensis]
MHLDDKPGSTRGSWATSRSYDTPRNPVGLALVLIVVTLLCVGTMLILVANRAGPFAPPPAVGHDARSGGGAP